MSTEFKLSLPTAAESALARDATMYIAGADVSKISIHVPGGDPVRLPDSAKSVLVSALRGIAEGRSVRVTSYGADLTTQEAADYLNVSRPYVIKLIDQEKLPFRMVGTHRRISLSDLEAYRQRSDERSRRAMGDLIAETERLGLYDD